MGIMFWMCFLCGCSENGSLSGNQYLVKVGIRILTVEDFLNSFEFAKIAYSHNDIRKPDVIQKARLRFLNQMIEEMIMLERARELNIQISDAQLEAYITKIKEDYPEGVFEQMLLENVISYPEWAQKVKIRLTIDQVIHTDLIANMEITSQDVSERLTATSDDELPEIKLAPQPADSQNEVTLNRLRTLKAEKFYQDWIKELHQRYEVDINMEQWNTLQHPIR
jgi:hypothetical protein